MMFTLSMMARQLMQTMRQRHARCKSARRLRPRFASDRRAALPQRQPPSKTCGGQHHRENNLVDGGPAIQVASTFPEPNDPIAIDPNTRKSLKLCTRVRSCGRWVSVTRVVAPMKAKFQPTPSSSKSKPESARA